MEQEFLDRAYGVRQEDMTMEQYMGRFRVPFVLWANYPVEWDGPEETSLNFLGQYLLRYAGIEGDPYGAFLWDLQKTLPALTFVATPTPWGRHTAIWRPTLIPGRSRITSGCSMTACLTAARQLPSIRDNDKRTAAASCTAAVLCG